MKNSKKVKKIGQILTICPILVPLAGLEPARMLLRGILSPLRLPIPPQRRGYWIYGDTYNKVKNSAHDSAEFFWRRHPDLNWGSRLCRPVPYRLAMAPPIKFRENPIIKKWSGKRDSNSRHSPWQGDALPLSHSRNSCNDEFWWEQ